MKTNSDRTKKLLALQAAMGGNPLPLQELKQQMGRPYTDEELEERRRYLNSLDGKEHTLQEAINFFGRYEPTGPGPIEAYELPNGMMLYFNNRL